MVEDRVVRSEGEPHLLLDLPFEFEVGLQAALKDIWKFIDVVNSYIDRTAPFKMAKDPEQAERLDEVLYNLVESCRVIAVLIWPFLPDTAQKIFDQLQLAGTPDQLGSLGWWGLQPGHQCGVPNPLFPRRDLEKK